MNTGTSEIQVPDFGETGEIELTKWYLKEGDILEEGTEICDFSTDKAVFTMDSPVHGTLVKIMQQADSLVHTGQVIGIVDLSSSDRT